MSETQHSPSPFGLVLHKRWEPFTTSLIGSANREHPIALVDTTEKEEGFANVRLFCAAPSLLAGCEKTAVWLTHLLNPLPTDKVTDHSEILAELLESVQTAIALAKPKGGE